MSRYRIHYTGSTMVDIEADTPDEAEQKFWDDDLNSLGDAEIDLVESLEANE